MNIKPKLLWHCDFYDFPLDGVAEYRGQLLWLKADIDLYYEMFALCDWDDEAMCYDTPSIYYDLYEIPDVVMKDLVESHKIFQEMVGYHTDHDPSVYSPFNNGEFMLWYTSTDILKVTSPPSDTLKRKIIRISSDDFEWFGRPHFDHR